MTSVTSPRARSALVSAVALVLLGGVAGCDSGDDIQGDGEKGSSTSDRAEDSPEATTVTTVERGEGLDPARQAVVAEKVTAVLDPWFDNAFLGDFPRSDYSAAFAGFSAGAAEDAQRDLDVMTSSAIADQIESATATNRRVRLDVFAPDGHPHGATANFVLDFTTTGEVEQRLRVHGSLYLAKYKGAWQVFGYDVDEAVRL
jgi:hypothetical protein